MGDDDICLHELLSQTSKRERFIHLVKRLILHNYDLDCRVNSSRSAELMTLLKFHTQAYVLERTLVTFPTSQTLKRRKFEL